MKLNRLDKRSQLACLSQCRELLQKGASVLFFPEGTRATDMRLQEFKKVTLGAFPSTLPELLVLRVRGEAFVGCEQKPAASMEFKD